MNDSRVLFKRLDNEKRQKTILRFWWREWILAEKHMNNGKENLKFIDSSIVGSRITKRWRRIRANRINNKGYQDLTKRTMLQWQDMRKSTLESNSWIPLLKRKNRRHSKKAIEQETTLNCSWHASVSKSLATASFFTREHMWRMESRCFCLSRSVKQILNCCCKSIRIDSESKKQQSTIPCRCVVSLPLFISISIQNNDSSHKQFIDNKTPTKWRWIYTRIVRILYINRNPNTASFLFLIFFFALWVLPKIIVCVQCKHLAELRSFLESAVCAELTFLEVALRCAITVLSTTQTLLKELNPKFQSPIVNNAIGNS